MKLNRLESSTQHHGSDFAERAQLAAGDGVRRVEAGEGLAGDRERSLQQELAEFDPKAAGPFEGGERIREDAQKLAEQLLALGDAVETVVRPQSGVRSLVRVDDQA